MKKCQKLKAFPLFVLTISAFVCMVICLKTWLHYCSIQTFSNLSETEYLQICEEFHIAPEKTKLEYIYSCGRDVFGVRLDIDGYSEEEIDEMLTADISEFNTKGFRVDIYAEDSYMEIEALHTDNILIFNKCD